MKACFGKVNFGFSTNYTNYTNSIMGLSWVVVAGLGHICNMDRDHGQHGKLARTWPASWQDGVRERGREGEQAASQQL